MTEIEQSSHLHDDERIPRTTRTTPQGMLELADELKRELSFMIESETRMDILRRCEAALRRSASPAENGGRALIEQWRCAKVAREYFETLDPAKEMLRANCKAVGEKISDAILALTPAVAPDGAREALEALVAVAHASFDLADNSETTGPYEELPAPIRLKAAHSDHRRRPRPPPRACHGGGGEVMTTYHHEIERAEMEVSDLKRKYLIRFGWSHTSNMPGSFWLWRRDFAREDANRHGQWEERGPGPLGWPSEPRPYGVITADTDLAVSMTVAALDDQRELPRDMDDVS